MLGLLNPSSMTLLVLWMFCSEIIHFFIMEHFGYLNIFVTRNSSVLDILHICLLVYLVLYCKVLYYFLWIDFQKRNHWGKLCEHFYDFCWQIAYLPAKYEKTSIILFSFISKKKIILPLNKNSSLKNVNTLLFSFAFFIFSTFWVLFFPWIGCS